MLNATGTYINDDRMNVIVQILWVFFSEQTCISEVIVKFPMLTEAY